MRPLDQNRAKERHRIHKNREMCSFSQGSRKMNKDLLGGPQKAHPLQHTGAGGRLVDILWDCQVDGRKRVVVGGMFDHSMWAEFSRVITESWFNRCGRWPTKDTCQPVLINHAHFEFRQEKKALCRWCITNELEELQNQSYKKKKTQTTTTLTVVSYRIWISP